jgi:hypothetical protein
MAEFQASRPLIEESCWAIAALNLVIGGIDATQDCQDEQIITPIRFCFR